MAMTLQDPPTRVIAALAALIGALAVIAGAASSHMASGDDALRLDIAVRYAMWHVLAILAILALRPGRWLAPLVWLLGIAGFSGGLAAGVFAAPSILQKVTPFGGGLLILGWLIAAISCLRPNPPA
ncbi:MAG: DUF423 domain-containing protein [Geminicoccaceae bacterium]|nr:DUF423 domain-containing protein [Geminicoccaceae bacterium]